MKRVIGIVTGIIIVLVILWILGVLNKIPVIGETILESPFTSNKPEVIKVRSKFFTVELNKIYIIKQSGYEPTLGMFHGWKKGKKYEIIINKTKGIYVLIDIPCGTVRFSKSVEGLFRVILEAQEGYDFVCVYRNGNLITCMNVTPMGLSYEEASRYFWKSFMFNKSGAILQRQLVDGCTAYYNPQRRYSGISVYYDGLVKLLIREIS